MSTPKTYWSCDACDKFYTLEKWGWKHVVAVHDGAAWLEEISPERQAEITEYLAKNYEDTQADLQKMIADIEADEAKWGNN